MINEGKHKCRQTTSIKHQQSIEDLHQQQQQQTNIFVQRKVRTY